VRSRDNAKCYNQRNATRRRDKQTGLSTVFYRVAARRHLVIDGTTVTLLDVHLECDKVG
jgi:xylosylprotein 4-beta-galactosyltransferase